MKKIYQLFLTPILLAEGHLLSQWDSKGDKKLVSGDSKPNREEIRRPKKLIEEILAPLKQPREINTIIQEYMGPEYIQILELKPEPASRMKYGFLTNTFNNAGTLFAQKGLNGLIEIWDLATGTKLKTITGHTGEGRHIAFCGNNYLAEIIDKNIKLWDCKTALHTETIPTNLTTKSAFFTHYAIGKKYIATRDSEKNSAHVIDLITKQSWELPWMQGNDLKDPKEFFAFNATETQLAVASDKTIYMFDLAQKIQITKIDLFRSVVGIAFSHDSKTLAILIGKDLELIDIDTKQRKHVLTLNFEYFISEILFGKDDKSIIFFTPHGVRRVFLDNNQKHELCNVDKGFLIPGWSSMSPDQRYIASGTKNDIKIYANPNAEIPHPQINTQKITNSSIRNRVIILSLTSFVLARLTRDSEWGHAGASIVLNLCTTFYGKSLFDLSRKECFAILFIYFIVRPFYQAIPAKDLIF